MELLEHESERRMTREEAARHLRELADDIARHNSLTLVRDGLRTTVEVPKEVTLSVEVEVGDDGSEIEIELSW
jgi:amphi-Trp domain-containing protein